MIKNKKKKSLPKLIVVLGPTASGKSELAVKRAKEMGGEIISADSRQIFRGMDIGTAKEVKEDYNFPKGASEEIKDLYYGDINKVPHYMIDIVNPDQDYSLADYQKDAMKVINDIIRRGKIPIIAGGTGLYIDSIVNNLTIPKAEPDPELRQTLLSMDLKSLFELYQKLDPKGAKKIDAKNKRRLVRAIEVCKSTGKPFSEQVLRGKKLFKVEKIGISFPRLELYKRINKRVNKMFEAGLAQEVKGLVNRFDRFSPAFSAIGYKEVISCLNGEISEVEMKELVKRNSRRYAKRQMTWFKRDKKIKWIEG